MTNLRQLLDKSVKQYSGKTAMVMGERRVSYAELDSASNRVANALIGMKVRKGDRVAMLMGNSPEFAAVFFGIIKMGAIAVPLDTRYRGPELLSVCGNCRPKVLVTESPIFEALRPSLSRFDYIEHVITVSPEAAGQAVTYRQVMDTSPAQDPMVALSARDIATISYAGGPADHPKGACLSQRSLVTEALASAEAFRQTAEDVLMLFALPLYHMFGLCAGLLTPVSAGSTIVVVPGTGVSIGSLMEAIEKEKGTILHAVPYMYALAIKVAKKEGIKSDLSSLTRCFSGGAPLPVSTIHEFKQYYGLTISDIYGLTEATCQVSCPLADGVIRLGAAGKILPGFQVRIVDDSGNDLPPGQPGEIIVKGRIMEGYYNNPQATAEAIKNGWLYTGDIGKLDEDGYLFITGRKKRMAILKGQNVYLREIEDVLSTHPKIAQTRVIGVADRLRGEIVRAYIRLKEGQTATEHEIRQFCQERMADYRMPRQIIFTDALPHVATGKAYRKKFKEYLPELSPLSSAPAKRKQHSTC